MTVRKMIAPEAIGDLNLADPRLHAEGDLSEVWRHLRSEQPVYWHSARGSNAGFWVISKYADVTAIYRDKRFTSERGNVLDTLLAGGDSAAGKMLAVTDGSRHAKIRKIILKAFSPRALDIIVQTVRTTSRRLVIDAIQKGECDFASDVAANIPLGAICDLLGIPDADRKDILALTSSALSSDTVDATASDAWAAKNEILLYFADIASTRRDTPHNDVISLLAASEVDGAHLDDVEIMLNCYSLILGGDETTRLSMIGGLLALIEHPEQWQSLKQGKVTIEAAVEEVLRWTTPALHAGRTAIQDVEVEGHPIRSGDIVTIWNSSANQDERVFVHPDRFELDRSPNKHLTFAYGAHFCLGAYLARMEIGAVLGDLREMVTEVELVQPPRPIFSNFLSGMSTLGVRLKA
jgi:cytochrome P450